MLLRNWELHGGVFGDPSCLHDDCECAHACARPFPSRLLALRHCCCLCRELEAAATAKDAHIASLELRMQVGWLELVVGWVGGSDMWLGRQQSEQQWAQQIITR